MTENLLMEMALAEAVLAKEHGDVPVGALVVRDGVVLSSRHNERELTGDPTAHAEILALRDAAKVSGGWNLSGCALVSTLEPCLMCAGALVASRVDRLVFGAWDSKAGACGSLYDLCSDSRLNHQLEVVSGISSEVCSDLIRSFFRDLRRNK